MKQIFLILFALYPIINCHSQTSKDYYDSRLIKAPTAYEARVLQAGEHFSDDSAKTKVQEAVVYFTKAIELNPKFRDAYYKRAIEKGYLQDFRGALIDYNKVIVLNPNEAEPYIKRGDTKSALSDYQGAIADYSKAIKIDPKNAGAYYDRGDVKLMVGIHEGGCLDLSKAGELGYGKAYELIAKYCH